MKKGFIFFYSLFILALASCGFLPKEEPEEDAKLKDDTIWVYESLDSTKQIPLKLEDDSLQKKYSGKHCTIYYSSKLNHPDLNSRGNNLSDNDFIKVANVFDSIYDLETRILGSNKSPYNNNYHSKSVQSSRAANDEIEFTNGKRNFDDDLYIITHNTSLNSFGDSSPIKKINGENFSSQINKISFVENENSFSYLDIDYVGVERFQQNSIREVFDNIEFNSNARAAGTSYFPETNSKVIIVIMDINKDGKNSNDGNISGTVGYFSPKDMIGEAYLNGEHGNERQILYLDTKFLKERKEMVYSTIVHEFNHLLNFIQKNVKNNKLNTNIDTWLTEMLSMVTEDLFSDYLGLKIASTPRSRLTDFCANYNQGYIYWPSDNDYVLNSYANAFAFGAYLVRNYGGINLLNEIATNEFFNEAAVTNAVKKMGYNLSFEELNYNFYKAILNTNSYGNTLNKSTLYYKSLCFFPISLKDITYKNDGIPYDCYPNLYDITDEDSIGPQGAIIQKIEKQTAEDINSITFTKPSKSFIKIHLEKGSDL